MCFLNLLGKPCLFQFLWLFSPGLDELCSKFDSSCEKLARRLGFYQPPPFPLLTPPFPGWTEGGCMRAV